MSKANNKTKNKQRFCEMDDADDVKLVLEKNVLGHHQSTWYSVQPRKMIYDHDVCEGVFMRKDCAGSCVDQSFVLVHSVQVLFS